MNAIKSMIYVSFVLVPSLTYAIMCPTNFAQIDFGNTIDQVRAACGKPDTEETKDVKPTGPEEWVYFVVPSPAVVSMTHTTGSLKTTVDFDKDGNVVNMNVNGIGVGASQICGPNVAIGDTRDSVKTACGTPTYKTPLTPGDDSGDQPKSKKITTWIYNTSPPVTLTFEDGALVSRQ